MSTAAATSAVPTTPPTTNSLTTNGEAANLASLVGTTIASDGASLFFSSAAGKSPSSSAGESTVFFGGSGSSSSSGGWASLSNGAKYAIYAGAAVLGLLIVALIVFIVRRRSRSATRNKTALRMTQRSSFASAMNDTSFTNVTPAKDSGAAGVGVGGRGSESAYSLDKAHYAHADAQSVHSVPPVYGQHYSDNNGSFVSGYGGDRPYRQQEEAARMAYPPQSPSYPQQQYGQQSPSRNQYAAFTSDDGYGQQQQQQQQQQQYQHQQYQQPQQYQQGSDAMFAQNDHAYSQQQQQPPYGQAYGGRLYDRQQGYGY